VPLDSARISLKAGTTREIGMVPRDFDECCLMVTEWCTTSKFKKLHGIDFVGMVLPGRGNRISYQ